jgi:hypothetical protein
MSTARLCIAALLCASATAPVAAEVENPGKVVCKSEMQAGTRVLKRTCMTAGEWDALAENAKRSVGDTLRGSRPWQGDDGSGDLQLKRSGELVKPGGPF